MPELDITEKQSEKIESLRQIGLSALFFKQCLLSDNPSEVEAAKQGYKELVDRFYSKTSDYVSTQQCKAAQTDFEYFLRLINLALAYLIEGMEKSEVKI